MSNKFTVGFKNTLSRFLFKIMLFQNLIYLL